MNLSKLHISLVLLLSSPALIQAAELNDTGLGENKYSNGQSDYYFYPKDVNDYPGQDPQYGRDASAQADRLAKVGGGHAGFDFSETDDCVTDNVTGLIWETKTDASDEGLQSNKWTFTYVDSSEMPLHKKSEEVRKTAIAEPETINEEITLDSKVLFAYDSAELQEEAKTSINNYVDGFRDKFGQIRNITVIGHTDGVASQKYNQKLSERRAKSVAEFLENIEGIPDSDIEAIGKGKLEPVDTNETEEGRSNNRRVVLSLELDNTTAEGSSQTDSSEEMMKEQVEMVPANKEKNSGLPEVAVRAICSDDKNSISCDTETYIAKMNEVEMCGYHDWRLPTREELRSVVDYGFSLPAIDKDYFPNTISSAYWTSSRYVNNDFRVWVVNFEHGGDNTHEKHRTLPIRLVRDSGKQNSAAIQIDEDAKDDDSISDFFSPITDLWK